MKLRSQNSTNSFVVVKWSSYKEISFFYFEEVKLFTVVLFVSTLGTDNFIQSTGLTSVFGSMVRMV